MNTVRVPPITMRGAGEKTLAAAYMQYPDYTLWWSVRAAIDIHVSYSL